MSKHKSHKGGRILTALLLAVILITPAAFAAGNGNGYVKCAGAHGGSTFVYSDSVGGTKLAKTSVLQFIYTGADNTIDPPDPDGNPTDDDVLIQGGTVGTPWNTDGEFMYFLDNLNDNAYFYVRAWNASTIPTATKYGDSQTKQANGGTPKPTPFTWNVPDFVTTSSTPQASITVTAPNAAGIYLKGGQSYGITWTSSNFSGNVKIEYSTNNGGSWTTISASTSNDGSETWTPVPSENSSLCLVRISDAADGSPSDTSDNAFTIDSTAPSDPTSPATDSGGATNNQWHNRSSGDPSFSWTACTDNLSGIAGYTVYWGTDPNGTPTTNVGSAAYNPSAIASPSTYYLRVYARDNSGNNSNTVTLFTYKYDASGPTFSSNPITSSSHPNQSSWYNDNTVDFSWATPAPSDGSGAGLGSPTYYYLMDQNASATAATVKSNGTGTSGTTYTSPAQVDGTWYLHLIAQDAVTDTTNNLSTVQNYTVNIDTSAPSQPSYVYDGTGADIDQQSSTTQLSANWGAATDSQSGIAKYEYAIGTTSGGSDIVNWTDNGTNTSVTKSGLTLQYNQTYYVSVRAVNNAGITGNAASSDGVTVVANAPSITSITWKEDTPDNIKNKNYVYGVIEITGTNFGSDPGDGNRDTDTNKVTVGSVKVPDLVVSQEGVMEVYYWSDTAIVCGIPLKDESGTNYTIAGDLPVVVTANSQNSNSDKTILVKPKVYGVNPTSGPVGTKVTIVGTAFNTTAGSNTVSFNGTTTNAASAVQNTTIEVNVPSGATTGQLLVTVNSKTSNTNYDWGNQDPITFTVTQAPATPTGLSESNITQTSARVSWEASATATSYTVSYGTDANATSSGEITGISTIYKDLSGLTANTTYYWKVKATNAAGSSSYSTIDNFTTLPNPPATPTGLSESNITQTAARVSWSAVSGAASYTVSRGTDTNATNIGEISSITDIYKDLSSLTASTKYYWKVKAVNAGGSSAYSSIEDFTTLAPNPVISKVYNLGLASAEAKEEAWVYVTHYDKDWIGPPDYYLNLVVSGSNFGEKTASGSSEAPAGGSVAVKPYGFSQYQTINDDASNPPDRMYWWQKDKIEIGIPDVFGSDYVVAGSATVKVTTASGSTEESFAIKPKLYGITSSAKTGEKITITGTAFGTETNNITVKFGTVETKPGKAENATLEVTVPADAGTGNVTAVINGQTSNALAFTVIDAPTLSVEPNTLSFTAVEKGANPDNQSLSVKNTGKGTLKWQAAKAKDWLSLTPASGETAAGDTRTVVVSINITGLGAGTYTDTITITSNGGSKDIPVTLTVSSQELNQPVITDTTPLSAPAGVKITVSGIRFGSAQGQSRLDFNNKTTGKSYQAEILSWSDTTIEAIVPRIAASGSYELKVTRVSIAAGTGTITAMESAPSSFQITAAGAAETIIAYPNPFNPLSAHSGITIAFNPGSAANIGVYIYDMTARLVYKEVTTSSQTTWDGLDQYKALVGDGVYLVRVINEDTKTLLAKGKILVVKK